MSTLFKEMGYKSLGFHLYRFEIYNWGTFNKTTHTIELQGKTALLTGANGSGKSTLVDGLLTLLVPNQKRNYNQASSGSGKKEREEKSYVLGYYGGNSEDESRKRPSLRKEGDITILLGYFHNEFNSEKVTLAQVLEMKNGKVKKFFIIADKELSIPCDFDLSKIKTIAEMKKSLKAKGSEIFDEFSKYSRQFRKRFGLDSENALILFNQIVTLKDVGNLNIFIRNYMLEKTDIQENINDLIHSFKDLVSCQQSIESATQQLEVLNPLEEQEEKRKLLGKKQMQLEQCLEILPAYFAQEKYRLLSGVLNKIEQELQTLEEKQKKCDQQLSHLRNDEIELNSAIKNDKIGQRLKELERQIKQQEKEIEDTKKKANEYNNLAQALEFSLSSSRETFQQTLEQIEQRKQDIIVQLNALKVERDQEIAQRSELEKEKLDLEAELKSLRQRKTQIPQENLRNRDSMIKALGIDESDIPFVGELLQVKSEQKKWESSIEKLLRGFGLSLLVKEKYYQDVNRYVNRTNLNGRLVYYKVEPIPPNPTQRGLKINTIPAKLEIKEDNIVFKEWIFARLLQQYNYTCCESIEEFNGYSSYALTQEGLMKGVGNRHEKDDRNKKSAASRYILGWNNSEKIKALESQLESIFLKLKQVNTNISNLEKQDEYLRYKERSLDQLKRFTDFSQIDWRSIVDSLNNLKEEHQILEHSSDHLKEMTQKLSIIKSEIAKCNKQRDEIIKDIAINRNQKDIFSQEKSNCEQLMNSVAPEIINKGIPNLSKYIEKEYPSLLINMDNIDNIKERVGENLRNEQKNLTSKINSYESSITKTITLFREKFSETVLEMGDASVESLPEYLGLKRRLEKDDLPRYQNEFESLMTHHIIQNVSRFKHELEKQRDDIKDKIERLNQSLRQIDYNQGTYIILACSDSRDKAIVDFKTDLKRCLENLAAYTTEDNKQRFQKIKELLIDRLQSEERWTSKVTDVRNWLEFSVTEYNRSDDSVRSNHKDSAGKSGGEKAKLTYTILAAAIAYQFGIHKEKAESKSFRFVVIDEIFIKLDKQYSRYVMELFKQLELQLLFITPNDKIPSSTPYIYSLHFVSKDADKSCSQIYSLTINEYQQKCQERTQK